MVGEADLRVCAVASPPLAPRPLHPIAPPHPTPLSRLLPIAVSVLPSPLFPPARSFAFLAFVYVAPRAPATMVNCFSRSPLALAGAALWLVGAVACFDTGRRLSWAHVQTQSSRTQARDSFLLQKLKFRQSGGLED